MISATDVSLRIDAVDNILVSGPLTICDNCCLRTWPRYVACLLRDDLISSLKIDENNGSMNQKCCGDSYCNLKG